MRKSMTIQILKDEGISSAIFYYFNKKIKNLKQKFFIIFIRFMIFFRMKIKSRSIFILLVHGVSGSESLSRYLYWSGFDIFSLAVGNEVFLDKLLRYEKHSGNSQKPYIFNITIHFQKNIANFILNIINHEKDVIILTRDPISRCKSVCNHGDYKHNSYDYPFKVYSCDINPIEALDRFRFANENGEYTAKQAKPQALNYLIYHNLNLKYYSFTKNLKNPLYYIDTKDISGNNTLITMKNVASRYCIYLDEENLQKHLQNETLSLQANLYYFLPFVVSFEKYLILIEYKERSTLNYIDIKNLLTLNPNSLLDSLKISVKATQFPTFSNDKEAIANLGQYMNNFLISLEIKIKEREKGLIKEEDILEYLRYNEKLRHELKNILDFELIHIKQHRPDIVASWKYYQEFEKICKELDGEEKIEQKQIENNNN